MVAREKELRNFFGNVVSALRETNETVALRACTADSQHRWHATRWQVGTLACLRLISQTHLHTEADIF